MSTMYCPTCGGSSNDEGARFCKACGGSLTSEPVAGPPPYVPNHLVWAILVTIFCCLPFGIVSIVYAAQVNRDGCRRQHRRSAAGVAECEDVGVDIVWGWVGDIWRVWILDN